MSATDPEPLRVALISSGLGFVARGIEVWMQELARLLPQDVHAELWSGGPPPAIDGRAARHLHALSRDARVLGTLSWHRRYQAEQLSALPRAILLLRKHRLHLAYCGDPVLSWHLKRFRNQHGARVVFMNGMRLAPNWAKDFDGVHLLAPPYLEQARRELADRPTDNFFAVPHCVDTQCFRPADGLARSAARRELKLPEDAFVVLTVGPIGHVSGKRLEWLAREVADTHPSALLVSAGVDEDGADKVRAAASQSLGERFRFLGCVERARMVTLYHAADVYSLGTLAEPFSIAILEALACGLPVVHHRDEVMDWQTGEGGVSVSMTEHGEGAAAFRQLKEEPTRRRELALAARQLAETRYAPDVICRQLADELRRIAATERSHES
jgi:1,2-diacylglycerol 3-alpha-glucosyltransferase